MNYYVIVQHYHGKEYLRGVCFLQVSGTSCSTLLSVPATHCDAMYRTKKVYLLLGKKNNVQRFPYTMVNSTWYNHIALLSFLNSFFLFVFHIVDTVC